MNNNPPKCPKCNTTAILVDAGIINYIPFWYCKKCKIEIKKEKPIYDWNYISNNWHSL